MNVVASSASSALTPAARSLKPSTRPPSARKKTLRSSSRSTPVRRLRTEKTTLVPRPTTFAASPVGARKTRSARPSRKPVSRSGASRKSSALRDGGVSRTSDVEAPGAVELVELGHRGELLRAGDRARELLVDAVGEDLVARALVGREALDELVEGALGVEHHRPQLAARPRCRGRRGARGRPGAARCRARRRPSALASRRAGSMVTTATRAPSAARPMASAADVVVLPTPPEPAQTTMRLPARRALTATRSSSRARRAMPRRRRRRTRTAASRPGRARRGAGARSWARWARARACAWRAARTSGPSGAAVERAHVGGAEALGEHAVARRRGRRSRPTSSRSASCRASVSLTGISSGRATATTPVRSGSETIASIVRPWRAMRPTRAASANVRGALSTATPWPVAGASRTTRS